MKTIRLTRRVEDFAVFASKALIRGDHIGPVPKKWRVIPLWWKTEGRRRHVARQGTASAREVDAAVALLAALIEAKEQQEP
ncbi:MAG: hypothetical protein FJ397_13650 [Verrucomicrobia bacterium]|nr:hypothetical protein [Verrucomicrobiota bacterium]